MSCNNSRRIMDHSNNGFSCAGHLSSDRINNTSDRSLGALLIWGHEKVVYEMRGGEELKDEKIE